MVTSNDVIAIMNQANEIQHSVFPGRTESALTVAEAYRLAELESINTKLNGIGFAIQRIIRQD